MSTSNIVPYYSSSPPPLDEDDDTAHSLDDNDDEFGDFSSASASVAITTLKAPANESVLFRPICKNLQLNDDRIAEDFDSQESSPISFAKNEPVGFSPVFSTDQFINDLQKDDPLPLGDNALHSLAAGKAPDASKKTAAGETKVLSELSCQQQASASDAENFEKTSDLCNSTNSCDEFFSNDEDSVKNEEFENPGLHHVLADQCSSRDLPSINSIDTMVPDALDDPVEESVYLSSMHSTNKQDLIISAEDEFDEFETFEDESACRESQLESVVSEHVTDNADIPATENQENLNVGDKDKELNLRTSNDIEKLQTDAEEFEDFECFQDESCVKPDLTAATSTSDDVEISRTEIQDDVSSGPPSDNCQKNAAVDFEENESGHGLHNVELCKNSVANDSQLDSNASKADSSNTEICYKSDDGQIVADTSSNNTTECLENQASKESTKEIPFRNEIGSDLETSVIEVVHSRESDEIAISTADDIQNRKSDFDEFDDFQFAGDELMNPPLATTVCSTASSVAATFKSDSSNSSWSAFSKESPPDETNEDSWASFNADTNLSSAMVTNEKQASASSVEGLKTPAVDWKESSTKSNVEESQAKFEVLTSRVVTNCYPLVMETSAMDPELLVDVIGQTRELTDISSKSPTLHTPVVDRTAGDSKSCLPDVCVWNNLKMMDLTSAFSFQWPTSSVSRNLLSSINVDLSSILVGHKKSQAPLFAPNLGLLEPMKAPTELQIAQADKESLTFAISDSSSSSSVVMGSAFSPQDMPQLEFDWGGSGLTNPLDAGNSFQLDLDFFVMSGHNSLVTLVSEATEKERELLDALEPPANESSMKMPPMSLETMMATLLPSIPSTQRIPKSQKDVDRKHLSEEAIQVLSKLPDLSFMQAKVLMFPLKDIASN